MVSTDDGYGVLIGLEPQEIVRHHLKGEEGPEHRAESDRGYACQTNDIDEASGEVKLSR